MGERGRELDNEIKRRERESGIERKKEKLRYSNAKVIMSG